MPYPVHDAVTAVLVHGDEIFIVRRQPRLLAFPGYWAFPGGKVDRTDRDEPLTQAVLAAQPPRLVRALVRELQEETGLDLLQQAAAGKVRGIHCLGEITTPAFAPLRYRTWFFRVDLRERPELTLDPGEAADGEWATAARWRERYARGRLLIAPPTLAAVERLAAHPDATAIPEFSGDADWGDGLPTVAPLGGLDVILARSNTLPPAQHTNAFVFGDERRVLVDPSPADRAELQRLYDTLDDAPPQEIFLTHHHPDHREYADDVARRYGVPVGMSADTRERIARRTAGRFFEGVETRIYAEGDRLTEWQGEPVRLVAVPGHDEGQLAPMPESRAWCIVSDLIQGVGTVVIGGPESSMRKYFASLQRVIDLDPAVILPSHGQALGTTHYIQETLRHRQHREQQVAALHRAGHAPEAMVPLIYAGLDPPLLPLARMNIESHLAKLREDGAIA